MNEKVLIDKQTLTNIADSIRNITGETETYLPTEMSIKIDNVMVAKPEEEKTIDVTQNGTTVVTPTAGKVLNKVTVNTNCPKGAEIPYCEVLINSGKGAFTPGISVGCSELKDNKIIKRNIAKEGTVTVKIPCGTIVWAYGTGDGMNIDGVWGETIRKEGYEFIAFIPPIPTVGLSISVK